MRLRVSFLTHLVQHLAVGAFGARHKHNLVVLGGETAQVLIAVAHLPADGIVGINLVTTRFQLVLDVVEATRALGGLAEKPFRDALVGEFFYRILMDQFVRSRDCDVNYYENPIPMRFLNADGIAIKSQIQATFIFAHLVRRNSRVQCLPDKIFQPKALPIFSGSNAKVLSYYPAECRTDSA